MVYDMLYPPPLYYNFDPQTCTTSHTLGNYGQSPINPATPIMKVEVDGPNEIAERSDSMQPPTSTTSQKPKVTSPTSTLAPARKSSDGGVKRRQSRFDPMGSDAEDEGYGEYRHTFRKMNDEDKRGDNFTLPGIKSLLNPSNGEQPIVFMSSWSDREPAGSSSASVSSHQTSLPSLASNSPGGSPSTIRSSRYSSLASGSSMGDAHQGWWNPKFERPPSTTLLPASRASPILHNLQIDDHDAKRRRSDQSPIVRDNDEQNRMRWLAQSRNASYPIANNSGSSSQNDSRMMHPPSAPNARGSISHHDSFPFDRRPSAANRTLSLVYGPLSRSFAEMSATERDKERERQGSMSGSNEMPPPYGAPGPDRRGSSMSIADIQKQRAHTATPPERFRAQTNPSGSHSPHLQHSRSSLSELIKAQSGDGAPPTANRFETHPLEKSSLSEPGSTAWLPSRRSSASSTRSNSTPGMTVNLNSDDGYPRHQYYPAVRPPANQAPGPGGDSMSGMDMLAESARRVSEQDDYRRGSGYPDDRDDSPKPGQVGPKYQCAYCTKTFSRPSSLRIHTYSRTSFLSVQCPHTDPQIPVNVHTSVKNPHADVASRFNQT